MSRPPDVIARTQCLSLSLALALALALAGACGGADARPVEAPPATEPAATHYVTDSTPGAVRGPVRTAEHVRTAILQAAADSDTDLSSDGRLATLAEGIARSVAVDGPAPPHDLIEGLARRLGLVEPAPHLLIVAGPPDPEALAARVAEGVGQLLPLQLYNRFGAAALDDGPRQLVVVALSSRWVRLTDLPRTANAGDVLRLIGALDGPFERPSVVVQSPDGVVSRRLPPPGSAFSVAIPLAQRGVHRVELLASGPRGDTVIANFPVFVDVAPDAVLARAASRPRETPDTDPRVVEARLRELLSDARRSAGLPLLALDPALAAVARAHGDEMVESGFVGHASPTTGTAADRVRSASIRATLVLENIGRGYGAAEIHQGFLESPGHRANLLNPDVTHVGIGVVAEVERNRTAFVATQVLARVLPPVDLAMAPDTLRERLEALRRAAGLGALRADPRLDEAAREAAARFFAEPPLEAQAVVDEATAALGRSRRYGRVGGVLSLVSELDEATELEILRDRNLRAVGIGVASGDREGVPFGTLAVVYLLAWAR